ncbi:hypothetical protein AB0M43_06060 [Longispora sp. NPDC051575]|uniref:hypothetical protein n=1 Tax=Longispora sp. NPDC051575 TaxID=3154943 RepID=UPI0034317D89
MHTLTVYGESRLQYWRRVREFAVPPSMIESATARRTAGDWAGACTAARVDVDVDLPATTRAYGREFADLVRADLRLLAPDLLRWHLPRITPDGLLRPGLTVSLTRYPPDGAVHLVVRTPPAWADAGQRVSLALWDASRPTAGAGLHPHPHPDRRYRLDLHRHLWDAHRAGEFRARSGVRPSGALDPAGFDPARGDPAGLGIAGCDPAGLDSAGCDPAGPDSAGLGSVGTDSAGPLSAGLVPAGTGCAVHRWADEATILLRSQGRDTGTVAVRLSHHQRLLLHVDDTHPPRITAAPARGQTTSWPVLPDAATWVPPDLALLRAGLIGADLLHPLVAAALVPGSRPAGPGRAAAPTGPRVVECRGARHRIGFVDGALVPLDHDRAELHREELLVALGGPPVPCLRAIDAVNRHPECLPDIRARLDHGDATGALAVLENLLGPEAVLRDGALRDELDLAARRQATHALYRAGLAAGPPRIAPELRRTPRLRKRRTSTR